MFGHSRWGVLLTGWLATGCAWLVDLDADRYKARGEPTANERFAFAHYLKADPPQASAWFGFSVAADSANIVVAAPFEPMESAGEWLRWVGAVYVFDASAWGAAPKHLRLPWAGAEDGNVPKELFDSDVRAPDVFGGLFVDLSRDFLVVSALGEDSFERRSAR